MKKLFLTSSIAMITTLTPIATVISCGSSSDFISMRALNSKQYNGFEISTYELPNQYSYDPSKNDGSVLGPVKTIEIYVSIKDLDLDFEQVAKQAFKYTQEHSKDILDDQNARYAIQVGTEHANEAWINMFNRWKKEWVDKEYMKNNPTLVANAIYNIDTETTLARANSGAEVINASLSEKDYIDIFDRIANLKTPTSKVLDFSNWK